MSSNSFSRLRRFWGNPASFESSAALGGFLAIALAKVWCVFFYRFDSDEPQHLHVIWAWTHGLVQYRDAFDNHMPFFQLLCAPVFGILGEHARDLYVMRLLMLPLFVVSVFLVFRLARLLFSRRIAIWSVIALGLWPAFFFCSTEFRTDNLWTVFWLLSLYVLLRGALRWRRMLVAGLLLGLAFAVSMKSTLLLLSMAAGIGSALLTLGGMRRDFLRKCLPAFLVGLVLPSLAIFVFFAAKGLWPAMRYGVFEHNLGTHYSAFEWVCRGGLLAGGLICALLFGQRMALSARHPLIAFRRAFLGAACVAYLPLLFGLWNHVTRQDFLPFYPMAAILSVVLLREIAQKIRRGHPLTIRLLRWPMPALGLLLILTRDLLSEFPFSNQAVREVGMVHDVLALTADDQYVFDCKGETVFRPRAVFPVFEGLTRARMRAGLLDDKVAEGCAATHACVAVMRGRLPKEDYAFIRHNYLLVGESVRVAGSWLQSETPDGSARFKILVPALYEVVAKNGKVRGWLDGTPCDGARFLAPGPHEFRAAAPENRLAIVWAPAITHHFTPFAPRSHSVSLLAALKGSLGRRWLLGAQHS